MLPPELDVKRISQFTLLNNELNAKVLYTFQKPMQYYYLDNRDGSASVEFCEGLYVEYIDPSFYVDSQGREAGYPKFYRNAQDVLAKEQRKLSHMKCGSNNYHKQKLRVARIQERIANQRKDWIHKLSIQLANEYDYICVEDINMQNMAQSLKLGKPTNDNGFGMFRTILTYKLADRGKKLIKIDKWFPSSKMCRFCGTINKELTLSDRVWTCECGKTLNRDENAAINIMNAGLNMV